MSAPAALSRGRQSTSSASSCVFHQTRRGTPSSRRLPRSSIQWPVETAAASHAAKSDLPSPRLPATMPTVFRGK